MQYKNTLFLIFLSIIFSLAGCQTNQVKKTDKRNMTTLRMNFCDGDLPSIHPHLGADLRCRSLEKALFEGLTRINFQGHPEPTGAERIEISDNQRVYTFHLRPQKWTNGDRVTAHDFELTWKNALAPDSDCRSGEYFYCIKNAKKAKLGELPLSEVGIKAIDQITLVVELEKPTPYFLDLVATPLYSPVYKGLKEEPSIFNGPYQLASWNRNQSLTLIKNPNFWNKKESSIEKFEFYMIQDSRVAVAMFEKNELDWLGDPFCPMTVEDLEKFQTKNLLKTKEIARVYNINCNTQCFPISSSKIRKALSLSIDRQEMSDHVLLGQTPYLSPIPSPFSLVNIKNFSLKTNEDKARLAFKEGLEELNIIREEFPILTLKYSLDSPLYKNIAQYLQQKWEKVLGIKTILEGRDWNILFSELNKGNFQIATSFRATLFGDPIYHLAFFRDLNQTDNWPRWHNSHYTDLLNQSDSAADPSKRRELLQQAENMLIEELPVIPLFLQTYKYHTTQNLEGDYISPLGFVELSNINFSKD